MPPVCPSPRPETIGTGTPAAAATGARIERRLVADAAGAVLVDLAPGNVRQVDDLSRANHGVGQGGGLGGIHPAPDDRHQECGPLIVGHARPVTVPPTIAAISAGVSAAHRASCE